MNRRTPLLVALLLTSLGASSHAQSAAAADAEASKCLDKVAAVRREVLGRYEDQLTELQAQFQKLADLESALAVRAELQRVRGERTLGELNLVSDPKSLRTLQQQTASKMEELAAAVVSESIPRLVEIKKALTIAGQLDDAVTVRGLIEKLQNEHIPLTRPKSGETVPADTLLTAYAADRARADKAYKEARFTVRGTLATYRIDPSDSKKATIYLGRSGGTGWIACLFDNAVRFREEKSFNTVSLTLISLSGAILGRWQAGQTVEIDGTCLGFEDVVKLGKCELPH